MVQYEYLPSPLSNRPRRAMKLSDEHAARMIGERVLYGFNVVQRFLQTPDGESIQVTYFQSDVNGDVWAVYF